MQGSVWIATRPDLCGEWSQAGGILRLAVAGPWFAVVPRAMWPTDAAQLAMIEKVSARLHPPPLPRGPISARHQRPNVGAHCVGRLPPAQRQAAENSV